MATRYYLSCVLTLLAASTFSPTAIGSITSYRMTNQIESLNNFGRSFTFSVDDRNGDGIGSPDEIIDFSGIECAGCANLELPYGPSIVTLGSAATDVVFGGSCSAAFNLTTLNWTNTVTESSGSIRVLQRDFCWSDANGVGSPIRQFNSFFNLPVWIAEQISTSDKDGDGVADSDDNCPDIGNASQANTDSDTMGDSCDTDDDNDGVLDSSDAFPLNSSETLDTDNDGTGNNADTDDDGDGVLDNNDAFPLDSSKTSTGRLTNIATRGVVKTSDEVIIGGLIISGSTPKTVVIRARGNSLRDADPNLTGLLEDPTLQLFSGPNLVDSNDSWAMHARVAELPDNLRPTRSEEAALVATLEPGAYTAIVRGVSGGQGVGIVEIFELSNTEEPRLINIATRGFVGLGNDVLIGGLIIVGDSDQTVTIRARGPSLIEADPNLQNLLSDPFLQLFNGAGELIDSNDNWREHSSAESLRGDLSPTNDTEAVITRTLAPGAYTAIVRGNSDSTGIGIVEVFEID